MYLHIGDNRMIPTGSIIGLFDLETATIGRATRTLLGRMEKEKKVVTVGREMPRSFLLAGSGDEVRLYVSPISAATLIRRGQNGFYDMGAAGAREKVTEKEKKER